MAGLDRGGFGSTGVRRFLGTRRIDWHKQNRQLERGFLAVVMRGAQTNVLALAAEPTWAPTVGFGAFWSPARSRGLGECQDLCLEGSLQEEVGTRLAQE